MAKVNKGDTLQMHEWRTGKDVPVTALSDSYLDKDFAGIIEVAVECANGDEHYASRPKR